jgi:hypothetical protein
MNIIDGEPGFIAWGIYYAMRWLGIIEEHETTDEVRRKYIKMMMEKGFHFS